MIVDFAAMQDNNTSSAHLPRIVIIYLIFAAFLFFLRDNTRERVIFGPVAVIWYSENI